MRHFCRDDSVILHASGGIAYQWFENGLPVAGATQPNLTVSSSGNWSVQIWNQFGCSSMSNAIVTERLAPPVSFNIRANTLAKCVNDSVLIEATFSPLARYQWLHNGQPLLGDTSHQLLVWLPGTYDCQISYGNGCPVNLPSITIREYELPNQLNILAPSATCAGSIVELVAPLFPNAQYQWRGPNGFTSNMHRAILADVQSNNQGWYYLTITVPACGSIYDSVWLHVQPGLGEITTDGRAVICGNGSLRLRADSIHGAEYEWELNSGKQFKGRFLYVDHLNQNDAGFATLRVKRGSCIVEQRIFIEFFPDQLFFPTAFTPNGDGLNDEFKPEGLYDGPMELLVYDRWGHLVFTSNQMSMAWDGTINGQPANDGLYTWVCLTQSCSNDKVISKGQIRLLR